MPFTPKAPIDLALKERIRVAYYDEARSIAEVEKVAGVGRATVYRWFHAWGWPLRKPMRSRPQGRHDAPVFGKAAAPSVPDADGPEAGTAWRPAAREPLKERLKRLVEHRIALLEHEAMAGVAIDPDANARAIEVNARTLVTIERLSGEGSPCPRCGGGDGRPQRSLAELRDALREAFLRMRAQARARQGLPEEEDEDEDDEDALPAGDAGSGAPSEAANA